MLRSEKFFKLHRTVPAIEIFFTVKQIRLHTDKIFAYRGLISHIGNSRIYFRAKT